MTIERIGSINTNAAIARRAQESLHRQYLYGLGQTAMDSSAVDPVFRSDNSPLMRARYAVEMARLVGQNPGVIAMPEGLALTPANLGHEALHEIRHYLSGKRLDSDGL